MKFDETQITNIVNEAWSVLFGLTLKRAEAATPSGLTQRSMIASINIVGLVHATLNLTVECPAALIRKLTSIMFAIDEQVVSPEETQDAFGELTNVLGGAISEIFPDNWDLSLPTVVDSDEYEPRSTPTSEILELHYECDEMPFVVTLFYADCESEASH